MSVRDDIAAAANTCAAVKVSPTYTQTTRPGDGWVSLAGIDRDDTGFGFMDRWEVTVVLPSDIAGAETWMQTNIDALLTALAAQLIVTSATPSTLLLETGSIPGLVVAGTRAH